MNSRRMERTGLPVSEVSRGTTTSGFQTEEPEAARLLAGDLKTHTRPSLRRRLPTCYVGLTTRVRIRMASEQIDEKLSREQLQELMRKVPVDLESTPEEDAEDLAAYERARQQVERGQYITLEELERKYPD